MRKQKKKLKHEEIIEEIKMDLFLLEECEKLLNDIDKLNEIILK